MATGTLVTAMRPVRIAFVVEPRPDIIQEAMALSSSLWGGCFNPVIPAFDKMPDSWIEPYQRTMTPAELVNGYLANFEPDYIATLGNIGDTSQMNIGRYRIRVSEIRGDGVEGRYPLVGVGLRDLTLDIVAKDFKFARRDDARFLFPTCDPAHGMFLAAYFGMPEATVTEQVVRRIGQVIPDHVSQDKVNLATYLDFHHPRYVVPRRIQLHELQYVPVNPRVMVLDPSSALDVLDFWNLRAAGHRVFPIPLQRLGEEVIQKVVRQFVEESFQPDPIYRQVFQSTAIYAARSHRKLQEVAAFGQSLGIERDPGKHPKWMASEHYPRLESLRLQHSERIQRMYSKVQEARVEGEAITLDPIKPDFHISGMMMRKRFANLFQYRIQDAVDPVAEIIPTGVATEDVLKPSAMAIDTLNSRDGITLLCEPRTLRSSLHIPNARDVCVRWLETKGWHDVAVSSAGQVAYAMIQALGGAANIMQLAYPPLLKLLDQYASERETHRDVEIEAGDGAKAERFQIRNPRGFPNGDWLRVSATILPVSEEQLQEDPTPEGKKRAESFAIARRQELLDFMLKRGVVKLGAELVCPTCSRANWRAVNALDYQLRCDFCLASFHIDPTRIAHRSTWTYKPNGPFAIAGHGDGAYSVLLTLAKLTSLGLPLTSPLLSFKAKNLKGEKLEADLLLHLRDLRFGEDRDSQVVFAECKSMANPCFTQWDIDRMRVLAQTFPGSILVFACLKDQLMAEEVTMLRKFEEDSREVGDLAYCPTIVLTGRELLTTKPLPKTFEGRGASFDGPGGLQIYTFNDLASATQIAHLEMQTYGEWWKERMQKA